MGNNSQQWTTMDNNNPQCYMHLWCRFSDIAHSRYVSSNMGETLICPILVLTCDKFDPFKPKMEESVLFLCTGGTIDKCYPRTQVGFDADGHPATMMTMVGDDEKGNAVQWGKSKHWRWSRWRWKWMIVMPGRIQFWIWRACSGRGSIIIWSPMNRSIYT